MVVDYREKKVLGNNVTPKGGEKKVPQNRPRREPSGMFGLAVLALLVTFGAGVGTGFLLAKVRKAPQPAVAAQPAKKDEAAPAQPAGSAKAAVADPPLTFYQTLPAGGKGAIGSGLNLKKPDQPPAAAKTEKPAAAAGAPKAAAPVKPAAAEGHFVVQVASYREKKEAETAQGKLNAKGLAAYVVESRSAEKGVWYRLRVGKHLSREEADDLAGNAGQGAIVVPE